MELTATEVTVMNRGRCQRCCCAAATSTAAPTLRCSNCCVLSLVSKPERYSRRATSRCAGAASSSSSPSACLKARILAASSPLRCKKGWEGKGGVTNFGRRVR